PASITTPERNNYFLSSLRRFETVHVFSSDRDIVLKWASTFANWSSEPIQRMAGRRLGNVFLVRGTPPRLGLPDSRRGWDYCPVLRAIMRNFHVYERDPLRTGAAPAIVTFHDCSLARSVGGPAVAELVVSVVTLALLALAAHATAPHGAWGSVARWWLAQAS